MHPIAITLGPLQVYSFSLALLTAFAVSWWAARVLLPARGMSRDDALPLLVAAAFGGIAGARLAYVAAHWPDFATDLAGVFRLSQGGLVFYGGVAGGALAVWVYASARRMPRARVADVAAAVVPLGAAIGRIGCFLNGCCGGLPCDRAWAVRFPGEAIAVHPTQLYDAAYNLVLFGVMFTLVRRTRLPDGAAFWLFVSLYGALRFVVEAFRVQSAYVMGLSGAQVISSIVVPVSLAVFVLALVRSRSREARADV